MILLTIILMNILWIGYSLTEGIREGFYWHYENKSKKFCDFDVNPMFHLQRILILFISGGFMVHTLGWYSLLNLASMMLMFMYFHNGSYYCTRNKLDSNVYYEGWKDESKTSPKLSVLTKYSYRTVFMCVGVLFQIFIYLFLLT